MIFNCPECNAGHSVPVSMIPNGGLDMDCRRCGEAFTIEPPHEDSRIEDTADDPRSDGFDPSDNGEMQGETTSVGPPPVPEPTKVGVVNPLQVEVDHALIGPGGIDHSVPDRPTVPRSKNEVPISPDEEGLNPELDETIRLSQGRHDTPATPAITEPGVIEFVQSEVSSEQVSALEDDPLSSVSDSSPSLYERVAAGIPVPEEQKPQEQKPARPSSESLRKRIEKTQPAFHPADLLNRAPLALKVGLIVFPVTLGVMLVINAISEKPAMVDGPIEIPVALEEAPPVEQLARPIAIAAKPVKEKKPASRPPLPPPPREIDDAPAPEGFAYVQVEDAKLRVRPVEKSGIAGRVQMGGMVRVYDELGDFSLVAKLPEGPAGFLSKKLVGPRKPLGLLARDQAFERCVTDEKYTVDACLFSAKEQEQPCLDRCGAVNAGNEADRLRCAEICSIAFDSCARSCQSREEERLPQTKRRRRD